MAYMSKEHAKEIRTNLKKAFPEFKLSVIIQHSSTISVSIMEGPVDFSSAFISDYQKSTGHATINHYYIEEHHEEHADILKKMYEIINVGNHDNSDIMTDYFDVGFYISLNIGKWDKPYKQIAPKGKDINATHKQR